MSWEDEIKLRVKVRVEPGSKGADIKQAVIDAVTNKLQAIDTDVFEDLESCETSVIAFRTVRKVP